MTGYPDGRLMPKFSNCLMVDWDNPMNCPCRWWVWCPKFYCSIRVSDAILADWSRFCLCLLLIGALLILSC